jgi:hypothetical protein
MTSYWNNHLTTFDLTGSNDRPCVDAIGQEAKPA